MTAAEVISRLHEKKRLAPNWTNTKGIFADLSGYPDVEYYVKCPKCGQVHGSYKTMREAHSKRLCDLCDIEAINKLKKQVKEVDSPKNRGKPGKSTSKLFNEADEMLPQPPEFDPREYVMSTPYTGNWIELAMHELGEQLGGFGFSPARWERESPEDAESNFKYDVACSDGTEWRIFRSEDEAETFTRNQVEEQLRDEPGNFTQDWLERFINMDRLKDYTRESAEDIEWLLDMGEQEQADYLIQRGFLNEEDFYNEDGNFVDNEDLREAGQEAFREKQVEDFDPMEWFRDVYGRDEAAAKAIEAVGIDYTAAAQDAIDTDGWVHFANSYDGTSTDLPSGAVAIRTN